MKNLMCIRNLILIVLASCFVNFSLYSNVNPFAAGQNLEDQKRQRDENMHTLDLLRNHLNKLPTAQFSKNSDADFILGKRVPLELLGKHYPDDESGEKALLSFKPYKWEDKLDVELSRKLKKLLNNNHISFKEPNKTFSLLKKYKDVLPTTKRQVMIFDATFYSLLNSGRKNLSLTLLEDLANAKNPLFRAIAVAGIATSLDQNSIKESPESIHQLKLDLYKKYSSETEPAILAYIFPLLKNIKTIESVEFLNYQTNREIVKSNEALHLIAQGMIDYINDQLPKGLRVEIAEKEPTEKVKSEPVEESVVVEEEPAPVEKVKEEPKSVEKVEEEEEHKSTNLLYLILAGALIGLYLSYRMRKKKS